MQESGEGLRLLGVVHGARKRAPLWETAEEPAEEAGAISYRGVSALVYPGPVQVDRVEAEEVLAHHQRLDAVLKRRTVLPAPFGLAFRGEREVTRFLRARYVEIGDGLALVEGRWELRLHATPTAPELPEATALELATSIYAELRKLAHAALPLPRTGSRAFSAAFLVERLETRHFLERVEELDTAHPELELDATGPWPPYDFVVLRT